VIAGGFDRPPQRKTLGHLNPLSQQKGTEATTNADYGMNEID
jgi:hypothetical protein